MPRELPSGTVTFLFTDVEGSTRLLHELGAEGYAAALAEHRRVLRETFSRYDGVEVDTQGDAFFVAFPTAPGALAAAREMTEALTAGPIRVRIGLHTGTPYLAEEGYVGADVNRAARIAASGHGGQVLVSASTALLADVDGLRDLGEHRLKDLSAPERIYQLGDGDFPPLATLYQTNLPIPATPFLGRERELDDVVSLIGQERSRLLTLTGPGGTGKTRLALQAAGALAERYPHGVFWIPLAPLQDPALVLESAAHALGAADGLAEHIADKRLLLLFDNFEHVLSAADGVAKLLAQCPSLGVLVTSREPLRLTGEQEYPVPPFAHEEAVGFFAARARAAKPDFEVDEAVSEICLRLDDLPLALELAAARVKALSPRQILERLERRLALLTGGARDAPERQRTLRATIEWSHELLSPGEKQLLARLAVFRGGCSLEAAEQVCGADLDTLQSLVEKSLLRSSGERYWMLGTIREYAAERLAESGEAEHVARRHALHFLELAELLPPGAPPTSEWLDRLDPEHDNIRSALDSMAALAETQLVLRLAHAQWRFWKVRGFITEGRARLEAALAADPRRTEARGHALNAAAGMAVDGGDCETGWRRAQEALTIHRELGDDWGGARSLYMLGYAAIESGDFAGARPLFEECDRRFRELGEEHLAMLARFNLSWTYDELGNTERARELDEDNLRLARETGNIRMEAASLDALGGYAREDGRIEDAFAMLREAMRLNHEVRDAQHELDSLSRIAAVHSVAESPVLAAQLLASSLALHEEADLPVPLYQEQRNEHTLARIRRDLDEAAFEQAWARGRAMSRDEAIELALGGSVDERDEPEARLP